ncbi:DUF1707 domain-containing protein [Nocardioides sp. BGMRC 2183]|nr:DUF1707 domain-containing protein [Nocardioides sp. BGMRC 2183]
MVRRRPRPRTSGENVRVTPTRPATDADRLAVVQALSKARRNEELPADEQLERTERALEAVWVETLKELVADLSDQPRLPVPSPVAAEGTHTGTRRGFLIGLGCLLVGTATGVTIASVDTSGEDEKGEKGEEGDEPQPAPSTPDWSDFELKTPEWSEFELETPNWSEFTPTTPEPSVRRSPTG